jgi:hypothetical protein
MRCLYVSVSVTSWYLISEHPFAGVYKCREAMKVHSECFAKYFNEKTLQEAHEQMHEKYQRSWDEWVANGSKPGDSPK